MRSILVVDDDPDILVVMKILLKQNGYQVYITEIGEDAIELATLYEPSLILMDVVLKGILGTEVSSQLKSHPKTSHIPIILFSANNTYADVMNKCKADYFIEKPFEIEQMIKAIDKFILPVATV